MPFNRHAFWKNPGAPANVDAYGEDVIARVRPEFYLDLPNVTRLVVDTIRKYADPSWSIVELGSGTGRNLAGLIKAGFHKLHGVEINQTAVKLGDKAFPELAGVPVLIKPVEDAIKEMPPVDVIFTQGFLMLLPPDFEWVITEMTKHARRLIVTIEGERPASFHVWPHDYKRLIEAGGWHQVEAHSCEAWSPLPATTIARVFQPNNPAPIEQTVRYEPAPIDPEISYQRAPVHLEPAPPPKPAVVEPTPAPKPTLPEYVPAQKPARRGKATKKTG